MKLVIIEDENPALIKTEALLKRLDEKIDILAKIKSVKQGVEWFQKENSEADLILADIQLTDGLSFEIFDQLNIQKPIIFITAFDKYAIEAFKLNSIDYLLKPITFEKLKKSLEKLKEFGSILPQANNDGMNWQELTEAIINRKEEYKTRFGVKIGENLKAINTEDIACFYAEGRTVYLLNKNSHRYIIDYKLEELEKMLNPKKFFRVNRTFIIDVESIRNVLVHSNSRYKLSLSMDLDEEIIVSRTKAQQFKEWFEGN